MDNSPLQIPQRLVKLAFRFYRPDSLYKAKSANILKPMLGAKFVLSATSTPNEDIETLIQEVAAHIGKEMQRVRTEQGKGRWVISNIQEEYIAIQDFARCYVEDLYLRRFKGNKADLHSERAVGIVEDTFEMLTRLELTKLGEKIKAEKEEGIDHTKEEQPKERLPQIAQWGIEQTDEKEYLITGPGELEIVIKDLDCNLSKESALPSKLTDLTTRSIKYPLEVPTDYSDDNIELEVILVGNGERFEGHLHIGTQVSWKVPQEFARELQNFLTKNKQTN